MSFIPTTWTCLYFPYFLHTKKQQQWCGYSLELPSCGKSNKYLQYLFFQSEKHTITEVLKFFFFSSNIRLAYGAVKSLKIRCPVCNRHFPSRLSVGELFQNNFLMLFLLVAKKCIMYIIPAAKSWCTTPETLLTFTYHRLETKYQAHRTKTYQF